MFKYLQVGILSLAVIVFIVKIVLFLVNRSSRWTLIDFFYFGSSHFIETYSPGSRKAKKRFQNLLSITFLALLGLLLFITCIEMFTDREP